MLVTLKLGCRGVLSQILTSHSVAYNHSATRMPISVCGSFEYRGHERERSC